MIIARRQFIEAIGVLPVSFAARAPQSSKVSVPPRSFRYLHYDVFTDTALTGNQLAVFTNPGGLSTEEMARITREMNFSECTFIFPAEQPGTDLRLRIFGLGGEMPFAGHPVIGSTFALAHEKLVKPGQARVVFGLGLGPTPVDLEWKSSTLAFA